MEWHLKNMQKRVKGKGKKIELLQSLNLTNKSNESKQLEDVFPEFNTNSVSEIYVQEKLFCLGKLIKNNMNLHIY